MKNIISFQQFFTYKWSVLPDDLKKYVGKEKAEANLKLVYDEIQDRLTNTKFAKQFQHYCFVEGGHYSDYNYKEIEIAGVQLILSLRFVDGKVTKPFVDILYHSCSLKKLSQKVDRVISAVYALYSNYNLIGVRIECAVEDCKLLAHIPQEEDLYILAKPISKIDTSNQQGNIRMEQINSFAEIDYSIYQKEYDAFNKEQPELDFVKSEPLEKINECCQNDFVYKIYNKQEWIGLIILVHDFYDALYGLAVFEKIIFQQFRNKGISQVAQILAEQNVLLQFKEKTGFVLGTISPLNKPSLQSAIASGREVVLKKIFLCKKIV